MFRDGQPIRVIFGLAGLLGSDFTILTENTPAPISKFGEMQFPNWPQFQISETFDEIDVAANAFVFFFVGFETTAATLAYCMYELALNKEIQNKLRLEIQEMHQKYQKQTPEGLKELTYTDMVIKGNVWAM